MAPNNTNFWRPLWKYLNQPLFSSTYKPVLNPYRFWYLYKIYWLERCWQKQYESENRQRNS